MPAPSIRWDPLKGKHGTLGAVVMCILAMGTLVGIVNSLRQSVASPSLILFTAPTFLGTGFLFLRRSFFSSALAAVFSVTLFAATVIITESAKMEFGIDFPDVVFYEPLKSQALHALLAFVCLFVAALLWRAPSGWLWDEPSPAERAFAKATCWSFLLIALILAALNLQGALITQAAYHSAEWLENQRDAYAGVDAIWIILGISALQAALRGYGERHGFFYLVLLILLGAILYFKLLRGERSTAFGFIIFLALLYFTLSKSRWKSAVIVALIPAAFIFLLMWAGVRGEAAEKGLATAVAESYVSTTQDVREFSVARLDRFPKVTWDILETTFLYENGIRRQGETYRNLIPQRVPSFVAELIGYERPLTEPWVLAQYFQHGGGIFMVAEAYWNYGLAGVIGLAIVLAGICIVIERFYRGLLPVFAYGYYGTIVISAENVLVGVQPFVRGLEVALLVTLAGWILYRVSQRGAPPHPTIANQRPP